MSKRWLQEHFSDAYVKKAQKQGQRARAFYKLAEIDQQYRLVRPKYVVVDLGAAPGSWSQYLKNKYGTELTVIALDLLPMQAIPGVEFIQGDFTQANVQEVLLKVLAGRGVNLLLSDIAPNLSGIPSVDQARIYLLANQVLAFARQVLVAQGNLLIKLFQGEEFLPFQRAIKQHFKQVAILKPPASRSRSRELFLLAQGWLGE